MSKVYKIKTSFTFTGTFSVRAESEGQAREDIEEHCGLCMGGDIHTTLLEEDIDWNFNVHPHKETLGLVESYP